MMVDPDAPSRENPIKRSWMHWLIVNIKGQVRNFIKIFNINLNNYAEFDFALNILDCDKQSPKPGLLPSMHPHRV